MVPELLCWSLLCYRIHCGEIEDLLLLQWSDITVLERLNVGCMYTCMYCTYVLCTHVPHCSYWPCLYLFLSHTATQPPTSMVRTSEHQPLPSVGTIDAAAPSSILPLNLQSTFTPPMPLPHSVDPTPPQPLTQLGVPIPPTQLFWRPIAGNHITAAVPSQLTATATSVSANFPPSTHPFIPVAAPPNPGVPVFHYVTPSPYMGSQVTSSLQVPPSGTYYSN